MEGLPQATRAIGNISNHLAAEPATRIVEVTNGAGIEFLPTARRTPEAGPIRARWQTWRAKGAV